MIVGLVAFLWFGPLMSLTLGENLDVEKEVTPLIEKVKSADAATRTQGVRELVGLREAIGDELKQIVGEVNQGGLSPRSKASAMYLMGKLGLVQCKDLLEAEKNWSWKPPEGVVVFGSEPSGTWYAIPGSSLSWLELGDNVSLREQRPKAEISNYPVLAKALSDLRSPDKSVLGPAEDKVIVWNSCVSHAVYRLLGSHLKGVYPADVGITAIYLLGEFRGCLLTDLLERISLKDTEGICAGYPGALEVTTDLADHPAVVALVKIGRRAQMSQIIDRISRKETPQADRELLARTISAIDKKRAAETYLRRVSEISDHRQAFEQGGWNVDETLAILKSVESIIMQ